MGWRNMAMCRRRIYAVADTAMTSVTSLTGVDILTGVWKSMAHVAPF
jgi:hypothetical protein